MTRERLDQLIKDRCPAERPCWKEALAADFGTWSFSGQYIETLMDRLEQAK